MRMIGGWGCLDDNLLYLGIQMRLLDEEPAHEVGALAQSLYYVDVSKTCFLMRYNVYKTAKLSFHDAVRA